MLQSGASHSTNLRHIIKQNGQYIPRPEVKDCSVNTVPWHGADAFCKWLSKTTDIIFGFPQMQNGNIRLAAPTLLTLMDDCIRPSMLASSTAELDGRSVYSIEEEFPSTVTADGVVAMESTVDYAGEWVSDYFAPRHYRKDTIDPTGTKKPLITILSGSASPHRVLRHPIHTLTEREFGLEVVDDAGIYGFRVLMEVNDVNYRPASP